MIRCEKNCTSAVQQDVMHEQLRFSCAVGLPQPGSTNHIITCSTYLLGWSPKSEPNQTRPQRGPQQEPSGSKQVPPEQPPQFAALHPVWHSSPKACLMTFSLGPQRSLFVDGCWLGDMDFGLMGLATFGRLGLWMVNAVIGIDLWGTLVAYMVVIADIVQPVAELFLADSWYSASASHRSLPSGGPSCFSVRRICPLGEEGRQHEGTPELEPAHWWLVS